MYEASKEKAKGHPQKVMKGMGISYQYSHCQPVFDQWWFWNCENIPSLLPSFVTELEHNPMTFIGWGLSKDTAENIRDYQKVIEEVIVTDSHHDSESPVPHSHYPSDTSTY